MTSLVILYPNKSVRYPPITGPIIAPKHKEVLNKPEHLSFKISLSSILYSSLYASINSGKVKIKQIVYESATKKNPDKNRGNFL